MIIYRKAAWRSLLHTWAATQVGAPFAWGQTDCASLAREALRVMFGVDVIPGSTWSSAREAAVVLAEHGSIPQLLEAVGGPQWQKPPFLRAGDLVLLPENEEGVGEYAVMVCIDARSCLSSGPNGVHYTTLPLHFGGQVFSLWEVPAADTPEVVDG